MIAYRVVYRSSRDGKPFRVDESDGRRWKYSGTSFGTLTRALQQYPDAEVSGLARDKQLELETRPHRFDNRGSGVDSCWHCGHENAWQAHAGGAA